MSRLVARTQSSWARAYAFNLVPDAQTDIPRREILVVARFFIIYRASNLRLHHVSHVVSFSPFRCAIDRSVGRSIAHHSGGCTAPRRAALSTRPERENREQYPGTYVRSLMHKVGSRPTSQPRRTRANEWSRTSTFLTKVALVFLRVYRQQMDRRRRSKFSICPYSRCYYIHRNKFCLFLLVYTRSSLAVDPALLARSLARSTLGAEPGSRRGTHAREPHAHA